MLKGLELPRKVKEKECCCYSNVEKLFINITLATPRGPLTLQLQSNGLETGQVCCKTCNIPPWSLAFVPLLLIKLESLELEQLIHTGRIETYFSSFFSPKVDIDYNL